MAGVGAVVGLLLAVDIVFVPSDTSITDLLALKNVVGQFVEFVKRGSADDIHPFGNFSSSEWFTGVFSCSKDI